MPSSRPATRPRTEYLLPAAPCLDGNIASSSADHPSAGISAAWCDWKFWKKLTQHVIRVARTRNRTDRHNGYDGGEADDAPKDPFEGSSLTTVQHADDDGGAAPGLFRRRLAGLVVINGAMAPEWCGWKEQKENEVSKILAHIFMTCSTEFCRSSDPRKTRKLR